MMLKDGSSLIDFSNVKRGEIVPKGVSAADILAPMGVSKDGIKAVSMQNLMF